MKRRHFRAATCTSLLLVVLTTAASAQSGATRPRRVPPAQPAATPPPSPAPPRGHGTVVTNTNPASTNTSATGDTTHAFALLKQNQFEAAAREAKQIANANPANAEAWKIVGFAEFNLKQYADAARDLQQALDLQRKANAEETETANALAVAYARAEQFDRALPLLVAATTRAGAPPPSADLLYYRGLVEFRLGKLADAERSLNAAVKTDPKNATALFYLGRINDERGDTDAAIAFFNRATAADASFREAWARLTYAYLRRAAEAGPGAKADADYQNAVRTSDALLRLRNDEVAAALSGQALVTAQQYVRAVSVLERFAAAPNAQGQTLYWLGVAYSRTKSFPKAIATLERAAAKTPDDASIYRELGYAYEVSKQYNKALAAYQKGATIAPDDADFKESIARVKPFAK
jgi:tetratricopeptide (TPR) repeat protein